MEVVEDEDTFERHKVETETPVAIFTSYDAISPYHNHASWCNNIWDFALHRSLEIWNRLSAAEIARSIGELTDFSQRSLNGKLGSGNNRYFTREVKNGTTYWIHQEFKQRSIDKIFKPFSKSAIEYCRERARPNNL